MESYNIVSEYFNMDSNVHIRLHKDKERCVFTSKSFQKGEVICSNHVLVCTYDLIKKSELDDFSISWKDERDCIALGLISFINHSETPNTRTENDYDLKLIKIIALVDIEENTELTFSYKCGAWFPVC